MCHCTRSHSEPQSHRAPRFADAKRCIIQFDVSTTKECQEVNRISHVDVDSVELNSQKLENLDIVMYYSDGITELGYITLFAAAFPIGPLISLIASCIEIKSKLYAHLYIFRRPDCHRGVGIGKWIDVWELITLASIVSSARHSLGQLCCPSPRPSPTLRRSIASVASTCVYSCDRSLPPICILPCLSYGSVLEKHTQTHTQMHQSVLRKKKKKFEA